MIFIILFTFMSVVPFVFFLQSFVEVEPIRVQCLDQAHTAFLRAAFELFLSQLGHAGILDPLKVDQLVQPMAAGGDPTVARAVSSDALFEVAGPTGIQHAVMLVGHDVDTKV